MKNSNVKKICIVISISLIVSLLVFNIINYNNYVKYSNIINTSFISVMGKDKVDSIKILNDNIHENDLKKYGIDKSSVISSYNKKYKQDTTKYNLIIISVHIIILIILVKLVLKDNKKIVSLTNYISDINNGKYDIYLENCNEGDISKLENEIYKVMITLKENNNKLIKDKERLNNYIEDISHQIKTPMTSISMLLETLQDDINMNIKDRSKFLLDIEKQNNKINELILSLLKLARLDAKVVELKKDKIYVNDLLKKIISNLSIYLEIKNINIIIDNKKNNYFYGDFKWQEEAITNILKNSIEYSNDNSNIYISCTSNSIFTKITIKDEGVGISKEEIKHIFERFYKSKNSSNNSIGIGLSLSKKIIESNGGNIKVKSVLDKGTTFVISYLK